MVFKMYLYQVLHIDYLLGLHNNPMKYVLLSSTFTAEET